MRLNLIFILFAAAVTAGCTGESTRHNQSDRARIFFSDTVYDYGEIDFSSDGVCEFTFMNKGESQLVLKNVKATCGCTVPEWPREPVSRGEQATILVRYDTHRVGRFTKTVYVYSNAANSPNRLLIKGRVKPAGDSSMQAG